MKTLLQLAFTLVLALTLQLRETHAATLTPSEAQAYLNVVQGYQLEYGTAQAVNAPDRSSREQFKRGIAQSNLLDLDNDGTMELLLIIVDSVDTSDYTVTLLMEIWDIEDGKAILTVENSYKETLMMHYSYIQTLNLCQKEETWYFHYYYYESVYAGTFITEFAMTYHNQTLEKVDLEESPSGTSIPLFSLVREGASAMPITSSVSELQTLATAPILHTDPSTGDTYPQHATYTPTTTAIIAQSYQDILNRVKAEYGISDGQSEGLVASYFVDLNGDGQEELLLTYCPVSGYYNAKMVLEVWEYAGNYAMKTYSQSYRRGYGQPYSWDYDWRDVGHLYRYGDAWVLYLAGGGGTDRYESYDKVYSYRNNSFLLTASDSMSKYTYNDITSFWGSANDNYYSGEGTSVANAIPDWYSEFQAIQTEYLSGNSVELFYIDKNEYRWTVNSCESILQEKITSAVPIAPQVVIPSQITEPEALWVELYQGQIDSIRNQYGTSDGSSVGYVQSYIGDFTGNGIPELYLAYISRWDFPRGSYSQAENQEQRFHYELWQCNGDTLESIFEREHYFGYMSPDSGGSTDTYVVEKDGRSYFYSTGGFEGHTFNTIETYQNGALETMIALGSSYEEEYYVDNQKTTLSNYLATFEKMKTDYNLKDAIFLDDGDWTPSFSTVSALPMLANLLAVPEASDHYYGYPVAYGETVTTELSGALLALYQVEDSLYYGIVDANGKQEGRILTKYDSGNWALLHSATENLSYETITAEKLAYLSPETTSDSTTTSSSSNASSSSNSTTSTTEDSKRSTMDYVAMGAIVFGVIGLSGFGIYQVKSKKNQ